MTIYAAMGKISKNAQSDEKQKKISNFFQNTSASGSTSSHSKLFSQVGGQFKAKHKLALAGKLKNNEDTLTQPQQTASPDAVDDDCEIIPDTPQPPVAKKSTTLLKNTDVVNPVLDSALINLETKQTLSTCDGSPEQDIIPVTPEYKSCNEKVKGGKVKKCQRSFLASSVSSLSFTSMGGVQQKPTALKSKLIRPVKPVELPRKLVLGEDGQDILEKASLSTILGASGISVSMVPMNQINNASVLCAKEKATGDTSHGKKHGAISSGMRKRQYSEKGEYPNPKRHSIKKTPQKSGNNKSKKLLGSANTPESHIIEAGVNREEIVKWGLKCDKVGADSEHDKCSHKKSSKKWSMGHLKSASGNNKSIDLNDSALDDILCEMKDNQMIPSDKPCKKTVPRKLCGTPSESELDVSIESVHTSPSGNINESLEIVDKTPQQHPVDIDMDAELNDIMSELANSLTPYTPASSKPKRKARKVLPFSARSSDKDLNSASGSNDLLSCPLQSGISVAKESASDMCSPLKQSPTQDQTVETRNEHKQLALDENKEGAYVNEKNKDIDKVVMRLEALSPFKSDMSRKPKEGSRDEDGIPPSHSFGRHIVTDLQHERDGVQLTVKCVVTNEFHKVILQGFWSDTHVKVGDVVHVLGEFDGSGQCTVTDQHGLIVINPDLLISGTAVVGAVHCMRRAVLNEKFKGIDSKNIYMLNGSIIHAIFQQVIKERVFTSTAMERISTEILRQPKFLNEMYSQDVTEASVKEEVNKYLPQIKLFAEKHILPKHHTFGQSLRPDVETQINDVADIEENVWSPRFGVKGKIDLTVKCKIKTKSGSWQQKTLPLELKTGKASYSIEHKGQVTLYSMMSSDRRADPGAGLLLYLKNCSMQTIIADTANQRGLLQLRNELAHYLHSSTEITAPSPEISDTKWQFGRLPDPINNERSCPRCPQLINCAAYQKCMENKMLQSNHVMNDLVPATLVHLSPAHLEFYTHWCRLLHLETAEVQRRKTLSQLWTHTAPHRERLGQCLSGMKLCVQHCSKIDEETVSHLFTREHPAERQGLRQVGLVDQDVVVVGAENKPYIALATGVIKSITQDHITLLLDRDLSIYPDHMETVYRIDKCDIFNTMATNFTNISRIMENTSLGQHLRELVIDKKKPEFDLTLSKNIIEKVRCIFKSLNKPQKTAILKVLMCKDYVLIKGYPGTGKTSTIVALVRIMVCLGKSILITSYTNSAVDNILLKLKQYEVDFVRVGRTARIHKDLQHRTVESLTHNCRTVKELSDFYASKNVFAATCLGVKHALFSKRQFDVCIVDEASQVLLPACLGPLFCCRQFVLVGDPQQLPPVVQSNSAREEGMADSLFVQLDDTGATYELNLQYRMNSEILRLSNELVYDGALRCGSDKVASARLSILNWHTIEQIFAEWIRAAVDPSPGCEVVWLNMSTSQTSAGAGDGTRNAAEARVIKELVQAFSQAGIQNCDIGVIAPYRNQVSLLRDVLAKGSETVGSSGTAEVEVNTVDQYQGRDKDVIIISFVRTHASANNGAMRSDILEDVRRLNVAVTRPRHKLVLVGSIHSLNTYSTMASLINLIRPQHIVNVPPLEEL